MQSGGSLPPPPWEAQAADSSPVAGAQYPQQMQVTQVSVTHMQPVQSGAYPQVPQSGNGQVVGMYIQPITSNHLSPMNNQLGQSNQLVGMHPQQIQGGQYVGMLPHHMQAGQMALYHQQMYANQMAGYGYGQQPRPQYIEQQMYGLSLRDDSGLRNSSYQVSTSSYGTPMKASKPEDKLFGDLVDLAKIKPTKSTSTPGRAGSM